MDLYFLYSVILKDNQFVVDATLRDAKQNAFALSLSSEAAILVIDSSKAFPYYSSSFLLNGVNIYGHSCKMPCDYSDYLKEATISKIFAKKGTPSTISFYRVNGDALNRGTVIHLNSMFSLKIAIVEMVAHNARDILLNNGWTTLTPMIN